MNASPAWISVIIPAHNAAATIERTLDSLDAQGMREWEAIVVDDRSSDATPEIVMRRAARDARIRLLSANAGGAGAARNVALPEARGDYLLFLDADDWISERYLERMRGALSRAPAGAVAFCAYQWVNLQGEYLPPLFEPRIAQAPAEVFTRQCGAAIHCIVVPRRLVLELGGFDPSLRTCEDWDLWYRVARSGAPFIGVDEPLAFYRLSLGSLTSQTEQLVRDGTALLRRTFGADPRLPPELQGPGTDLLGLGDHALWETLLYVWFVAVDAGRGRRSAYLLDQARPPLGLLHRITDLSETVVGAMLVGACCRPEQLAGLRGVFESPLRELFEKLEACSGEPGLGRALAYDCERRILHLTGLENPCALSRVMGARLDWKAPLQLTPPASVDLLYLMVCDGPRVLGNIDVPVSGTWDADLHREAVLLEAAGPRWFAAGAAPRTQARFARYFLGAAVRGAVRHAAGRLRRRSESGLRAELAAAARGAALKALGETRGQRGAVSARAVRWPKARAQAASAPAVPVLMYHRVADSGPEALARYRVSRAAFRAQMRLLRRAGFHALSCEALLAHLLDDVPLHGRPVLITFDDGYLDFGEHAWPVLNDHGLSAHVFIVTDRVGESARWDAAWGTPAPLMDWEQIRALSRAGVGFGSHLATHRRADTLSSRELEAELSRSRAELTRQLGSEITTIAAPFGFIDSRYLWLARAAGFDLGFSTRHGFVRAGAHPLALERLEVRGDMSLAEFEAMLGPALRSAG